MASRKLFFILWFKYNPLLTKIYIGKKYPHTRNLKNKAEEEENKQITEQKIGWENSYSGQNFNDL